VSGGAFSEAPFPQQGNHGRAVEGIIKEKGAA
jgi:hypothetical protein